ncbi:hypothetical protein CYY_007283 [Polysphondylium violaceum]|uniref:C3H1-type domain-containing protein n=1 Tax=Polysphondylium violaceum TaxID=133409 RepID=A0A8J4PS34_9MYCE|nr:hypothetical protein CYY_007283 [Polysphondylium violaceum]
MTEISNSSFFNTSNSNSGYDLWMMNKKSSGGLWDPNTQQSNTNTNNNTNSNMNFNSLKSNPIGFDTPISQQLQMQQQQQQQQRVPTSIKNSQFINISNQVESNWLSNSSESAISALPNKRKSLVKAYSEDNIQPPTHILKQLQNLSITSSALDQDQINEKEAQDQQEDIEDEITGQSRYKTELCRSFAETGICRYGTKCQFAHGRDELRPVMRHPKYKTETCKTFHSVGSCPYGSRCRFIHTRDPDFASLNNSLLNGGSNNSSASTSPTSQSTPVPLNELVSNQNTPILNSIPSARVIPQMIRQHSSPQLQTPMTLNQSQPIPRPNSVHWTNTWNTDGAEQANPSMNPLKSSLPIPKESKRLAIFKTICSTNPNWNV